MTITAENVVVPSAAPDKRRALGRGLESLLPGGARVASGAAMAPVSTVAPDGARPAVLPEVQAAAAASGSRVMQVPLDQIDQNPYQTRQHFDNQARSEERRVGKECRSRRSPYHEKKKKTRHDTGPDISIE